MKSKYLASSDRQSKAVKPSLLPFRRGCLLSIGALALIGSHTAQGAPFIWDGGGVGNNWNTPGNWDVAGVPGNGDDINFGVATKLAPNMQTDYNINSLTFASGASAFTLAGAGGFLISGASTFTITQSSANNQSIANAIGSAGGSPNSAITLALGGNGGGVVTLSGAITQGSGNRTLGITKSGTSTFVLTNTSNSFSNGIAINGGMLRTTSAAALGGNVTVNTNGILGLDGNFNVNGNIVSTSTGIIALNANNSLLSGVNGSSAFIGSLGNFTYSGSALAAGSGSTYRLGGGGGTLTISASNVITGSNAAIIGSTQTNGAGTVVITAAQNYSGTTTITAGTLQLGDGTSGKDGTIAGSTSIVNNANLVYNRFGSSSYGGVISGSGTVTKLGSGTQILTGNNIYTGITSITEGTFIVNNTSGSGTGTNTVSVASVARLFGTGTIGGATTIHGTQSSGASPNSVGNQTFSSSIKYETDSIFEWDIDVNGGTESHDQITANSLLGSGAQFKVLLGSGDTFADAFWDNTRNWTAADLFGAGNINANLANIFSSAATTTNFNPSPLQGNFSFTSVGSGTNNNLRWTAVPEPTSALAAVLLGAGLLRRRRVAPICWQSELGTRI